MRIRRRTLSFRNGGCAFTQTFHPNRLDTCDPWSDRLPAFTAFTGRTPVRGDPAPPQTGFARVLRWALVCPARKVCKRNGSG